MSKCSTNVPLYFVVMSEMDNKLNISKTTRLRLSPSPKLPGAYPALHKPTDPELRPKHFGVGVKLHEARPFLPEWVVFAGMGEF